MSNSAGVEGYLHIEGFDKFEREAFDKKKVRDGMRKAGRRVQQRAQMNLMLARGAVGYPRNRTGRLLKSISVKVSRSGFLVKVAPRKTSDMATYYPAYLHYGVKKGKRIEGTGGGRRARGARADLISARRAGSWRINPRDNYMADALQDEAAGVQKDLSVAFASSLK